jgi:hypothetical protein
MIEWSSLGRKPIFCCIYGLYLANTPITWPLILGLPLNSQLRNISPRCVWWTAHLDDTVSEHDQHIEDTERLQETEFDKKNILKKS